MARKDTISADASLPLVIVNPRSAAGSTQENWSAKASELRSHLGAFNVEFTGGPGDATVIAEDAAASGRTFIIACGGDGTINEVANGILRSGTDVELGVLPSGTGGDFRRTLGMPASNRDAAMVLRTGRTKTIDAGKVTFEDFHGNITSRYFLNISSFGLAASIIKRVKSSSVMNWLPGESIRGRAGYAVSTLQEVFGLEPVSIRVSVDGAAERTIQTINFCVANSRYFGGGMMIAPDARIDDGYLNIVNIGDISTAKILLNAFTLYRGTHLELKEVQSKLARKIEVRATDNSTEIRLEIDGELPGRLPATFEIVPKALRVRVPKTRM